MKAMVLGQAREPLELRDLPVPEPGPRQVRLRVRACGVCRTDLHIVDGELEKPKLPLTPGHQIVGVVDAVGPSVKSIREGDRVGVPWLGWTDGDCRECRGGHENLCENARFTGYDIDGGFAEATVADARYCFPIPDGFADLEAAPLLCAGLIGYRAYRMTGDAGVLGFYGFGAAAHILIQVARHQGRKVLAFTRPGDKPAQEFARSLGAAWAGGSDEPSPEPLDAAILFAPVGSLVPASLRATRPAGKVICAGIHMSDIPSFPYEILWMEREIRSVANLTRRDGEEFLELAPKVPVKTEVKPYPLERLNEALDDLREGRFQGSAVITFD